MLVTIVISIAVTNIMWEHLERMTTTSESSNLATYCIRYANTNVKTTVGRPVIELEIAYDTLRVIMACQG